MSGSSPHCIQPAEQRLEKKDSQRNTIGVHSLHLAFLKDPVFHLSLEYLDSHKTCSIPPLVLTSLFKCLIFVAETGKLFSLHGKQLKGERGGINKKADIMVYNCVMVMVYNCVMGSPYQQCTHLVQASVV